MVLLGKSGQVDVMPCLFVPLDVFPELAPRRVAGDGSRVVGRTRSAELARREEAVLALTAQRKQKHSTGSHVLLESGGSGFPKS